MRIGITFDLKTTPDLSLPDDAQEEFDSPRTIEAIAKVLRDLGHEVMLLGNGREFLEKVLADPPDFVFNFAEGQGVSRSREARVPAVLEMLGIPYTGSDPLTLAVTLDKDCAKKLVAAAGVEVPWGVVLQSERNPLDVYKPVGPPFPVIVKPAWEGSSKGVRNRCVVHKLADLPGVVQALRRDYEQPILIEEFILGEELTVGVYGNDRPEILGIMRIMPRQPTEHFVYGLEVKRDYRRLVDYQCPAHLRPATERLVRDASIEVFRTLGCRDIARIDFRLNEDGAPIFLEVNPLPGMNPDDSDLVIMAKLAGWTYPQLIETILHAALQRHGLRGVGPRQS